MKSCPIYSSRLNKRLVQVSGDGAYDTFDCYDTIAERGAKATIPPRSNAKIQQHGNRKAPPHPRDENLRRVRTVGRKRWKHESGYHRRSLSETTMFRLKTIFGGRLRRRGFDAQAIELFLQCAALNRTSPVGQTRQLQSRRLIHHSIERRCVFFAFMQQSPC